jgi:hypothetical protein
VQDRRVNLASLRQEIAAAGIRDDVYVLLGEADGRHCLTHNNPWWSVFYAERGARYDERRFESEGEACAEFLSRLLTDAGARK